MSKRKLSDEAHDSNRPRKRPTDQDPLVSDTNSNQSLVIAYPSTSSPNAVRPAPFQQPSTLLTFSYSPSRTLEFTNSALRYYVDPPRGAELRYGYERWVKRPEEKGRLDGLLMAVERVRQKMDDGANGAKWLRDIGVVSWRGVMTKILTAPYEDRDGWDMNVMEVNGTLYLEEHLSDAKLVEKENMTPHHRLQSYYGYAFESWCTSMRPVPEQLEGHPRGWGGDVDTNVQWCTVVKTKLGDTRMVIGGEVDCVRGKFTGRTDNLVELKTSMSIRGSQDEARFEKKLLKFYFQSFLLGVPEIVVGFRTPAGQITTIQSFKTIEMPRLVRGKLGAWDPQICLGWGHQFLAFLKSLFRPDDGDEIRMTPNVWRLRFTPRVGVSAWLLDNAGVREVEAGEERIGFLPKWYWDGLAKDPPAPKPASEHQE